MKKQVIKAVNDVISNGERLTTTDNYSVYGLRLNNDKVLHCVITEKRNVVGVVAFYVLHDEKALSGLANKIVFEKGFINEIGYSLEQSINEIRQLENYILLVSNSIKNKNTK